MLSRQDSSLSSSRRQFVAATPPSEHHHAKAIGCMSGIFRLFSKYHYTNKRITFGRKQDKSNRPQFPTKAKTTKDDKTEKQNVETPRKINVPRSPTLRPEIRLSNAGNSSESPRTPSSLVARLMGLQEIAAKKGLEKTDDDETGIVEKRKKLLQALEKCNEDLEELKRIIQAINSTTDRCIQTPHVAAEKGELVPCVNKCGDMNMCEELSPVSVLDKFSRSPNQSPNSNVQDNAENVSVYREPTIATKPGEDNEPITKLPLFSRHSTVTEASLIRMRRQATPSPPLSKGRRAMVQSVEEVCKDIAWGEKREIEKLGVVLQDNLCKDLVEEVVQELKSCGITSSLPLERCKRRLSF